MEPKKMSFHQEHTDNGQTEELISSLLSNRYVIRIMQENNLSEDVIRRHPWKIRMWLDDFSPCINCKGLNTCAQKSKGYYNNPVYDGVLQIEKKACLYQREKLSAEKHLAMYLINDLPRDNVSVDFSTLRLQGESQEYGQMVRACMSAVKEGKGLYICGPMGTGKTFLSACAANYMAKQGHKVCFVHYPSFARRIASLVKTNEYHVEVERMCYCDFLVIDDIGAEAVTAWNRDQILLPILNRRYDAHLPTWFTSNEDLKSLKEHFSISGNGREEKMKAERIIERISNISEMKTLLGEDRRKNGI